MLVWLKDSSGKWNRTGEELEKFVQIAIDAKSRSNGVYTLPEAISIIEKAIANTDNPHYRYELPAATAGAMRRIGLGGGEATPVTEKPKARKEPKAKKSAKVAKPVADEPARISSPEHTVELKPIPESKAFSGVVHGKKAVVVFQERNRSKAEFRYNAVTIPESKFAAASKAAKESGAPIYVGLQVRVNGKWDSGWLIPSVLYKQHRRGLDFNLGPDARAAYAADKSSVLGVRFSEVK